MEEAILAVGRRYFYVSSVIVAALFVATPTLAEVFPAFTLPLPQGETVLEVHGAIVSVNRDGAAVFDMAMLKALPMVQLETSTAVTDGVRRFEGFLMRDLLALVGASGATVTATALNDYVMEFAGAEFEEFDVVVAYAMDGEMLLASDKGPLWIVYPRDQHRELQDIRYDYRWVWQLNRLDIE
ncbi:MAG TPA: oxidoreductase [Devosia sp.]|nr:oxidoreductase [Devosia sp.]